MKPKYFVDMVLYELSHGYYWEIPETDQILLETDDLNCAKYIFDQKKKQYKDVLIELTIKERTELDDEILMEFVTLDPEIKIMY